MNGRHDAQLPIIMPMAFTYMILTAGSGAFSGEVDFKTSVRDTINTDRYSLEPKTK